MDHLSEVTREVAEMNKRIAKYAAPAVFLVAILTVPGRAAADNWKKHRIDAYGYDYRHDHHDRDDRARWRPPEWSEDQNEWREEQREEEHGHDRYSGVGPWQNYAGYGRHYSYNSTAAPYGTFNSGNYAASGAAMVRDQLTAGYANLQTAYANALAAGDRKGAQHYLNGLKQQQKEISQYNTTWGSTAGTISTPALPNNYYASYPYNTNYPIYSNPFQSTGAGLTPYNTAQIDPRLGAATTLLLMGGQMIHP